MMVCKVCLPRRLKAAEQLLQEAVPLFYALLNPAVLHFELRQGLRRGFKIHQDTTK